MRSEYNGYRQPDLRRVSGRASLQGAHTRGGGASALVGALGTALCTMVGNYTVGKKKYAGVEEDVKALMAKAEDIRARLLALVGRGCRRL